MRTMWRLVLAVLALVLVVMALVPYRSREAFHDPPPPIAPTGDETVHLGVDESSDTSPSVLAYQALTNDDSPGDIMAAERMDDNGIPLVYFSTDFTDLTELELAGADVARSVPGEIPDPEEAACAGVWDGSACLMQGDYCSTGDRVAVYERDEDGTLRCVDRDECHEGSWDGTACVREGETCSGVEEARVHVYVRDGDELVCTKQEACEASAWYSSDEDACKKLGDACTIKGIAGVVQSSDDGVYCQLDVQERTGFRLTSRHAPVESERACYDACVSRVSGCGAYSYDSSDGTCATGGLSRTFVFGSGEDTKLVFTEKADLVPVTDLTRSEANDSVTVKWEPFNDGGFEMRYSASPDMQSYSLVENSGDVVAGLPGRTYYFQPRYGSGDSARVIPVAFASGPIQFAEIYFDTDPADGPFHEYFKIVWNFTLPDGYKLFVRFPGSADFVERYGLGGATARFASPGTKDFECYVTHGQNRVYEALRQKEVTCAPSKFKGTEGTCVLYEILAYDVAVADTVVSVTYNIRTASSVSAAVFVGDREGVDVGGGGGGGEGTFSVDLLGPVTFDVVLVISDESGELHRESVTKTSQCAVGTEEFRGVCVEKCPQNSEPAKWTRDRDGACVLSCDRPYVPRDNSTCVLGAGVPCGDGDVTGGTWLADGIGGCDLECAYGYDINEAANKCLQTCGTSKPAGSEFYWTEDTHECLARCTVPGFTVVGNRCQETCPEDGETHFYAHNSDGSCAKECRPVFVFNSTIGECVVPANELCGDGTVDHGEWITDGAGGCTLFCDDAYEEKDNSGSCVEICDQPFEGAFWVHDDNGACVAACPEGYVLYTDGEETKCVMEKGKSCGSVDGGTFTADGAGGCGLVCLNGYSSPDGLACVLDLEMAFSGQVQAQTAKLEWSVEGEAGLSVQLVGPDVNEIVGLTGSFEKWYGTSGKKEFELYARKEGVVVGTKKIDVDISCAAYDDDGTCKQQGEECGVPPSNGQQIVDASNTCFLQCNDNYSIVDGTCSPVAVDVNEQPQGTGGSPGNSGAGGEQALPPVVPTGGTTGQGSGVGGSEQAQNPLPPETPSRPSLPINSPVPYRFVERIEVKLENQAPSFLGSNVLQAGVDHDYIAAYLDSNWNKLHIRVYDTANASWTPPSKKFEVSSSSSPIPIDDLVYAVAIPKAGVPDTYTYQLDNYPTLTVKIFWEDVGECTDGETGACNTADADAGPCAPDASVSDKYERIAVADDEFITMFPLGGFRELPGGQFESTGVVDAECAVQCSRECDARPGCQAFTFYESGGGYYETGRRCKLMQPDSSGTFQVGKNPDRRFSSWKRTDIQWERERPPPCESPVPDGYLQLDLPSNTYLETEPLGGASCSGSLCDSDGVVAAECSAECARICDDTDGCRAFTFYEDGGGYHATGRRCKLMSPGTGAPETDTSSRKTFSTWKQVEFEWGGVSTKLTPPPLKVTCNYPEFEAEGRCLSAGDACWAVPNGMRVMQTTGECEVVCNDDSVFSLGRGGCVKKNVVAPALPTNYKFVKTIEVSVQYQTDPILDTNRIDSADHGFVAAYYEQNKKEFDNDKLHIKFWDAGAGGWVYPPESLQFVVSVSSIPFGHLRLGNVARYSPYHEVSTKNVYKMTNYPTRTPYITVTWDEMLNEAAVYETDVQKTGVQEVAPRGKQAVIPAGPSVHSFGSSRVYTPGMRVSLNHNGWTRDGVVQDVEIRYHYTWAVVNVKLDDNRGMAEIDVSGSIYAFGRPNVLDVAIDGFPDAYGQASYVHDTNGNRNPAWFHLGYNGVFAIYARQRSVDAGPFLLVHHIYEGSGTPEIRLSKVTYDNNFLELVPLDDAANPVREGDLRGAWVTWIKNDE